MNWSLLANSMRVAGASTLLALFFGLACAVVLSASSGVLRRMLLALTIAVLALPSFLVTNTWIDLLGVNGALRSWIPLNIFSSVGAIWILLLLLWPIPALAIWSAWQKLEPVHFEVDSALRGMNLFRFLLWPAARQQIGWSAAVVFALALNNFAVPTLLQVKVFTSEVWVQFNTHLDAVAALQLSWPLVAAPVVLLLLARHSGVPWPRETAAENALVLRRQLGRVWVMSASGVATAVVLTAFIAPLAQIAAAPRTWSEFLPALSAGRSAVLNSLTCSVSAAIFASAVGVLLARRRRWTWLWFFFFLPGVLLGVGALTAFSHPIFDVFSRTVGIVIALLVLRYSAIARSLGGAAVAGLDQDLLDSARLDGARRLTLFTRIVFPQIAPQITAAAYVIYLLCLWDVETILLVIPPGGETLSVRIFNLLHYGHNAHVNALCLLLLLLALAPLALVTAWKAVRR